MPRIVDKIPNAWEPYMDGNLWEFTQQEWDAMPSLPTPGVDENKFPLGPSPVYWPNGEKVYVRFLRPGQTINHLTGELRDDRRWQ